MGRRRSSNHKSLRSGPLKQGLPQWRNAGWAVSRASKHLRQFFKTFNFKTFKGHQALLYIKRKQKIFCSINFMLFHITLYVISWCATYGPPCRLRAKLFY